MLKKLRVKNFRNLDIEKLNIKPGIVVIVGDNGQGKTNLLEAIYFLSYGKSFRGAKIQGINWDREACYVIGETTRDNLEIHIRRDKENTVLINGKKKKLSTLVGRFICVGFHPEEIEVINGAPSLRRVWLDRLISTTDKKYLFNLINYQKSLINKNKLLKTPTLDQVQVEIWNKNLASLGTKIWKKRQQTIFEINQILKLESIRLIGKKLTLDYKNPIFDRDIPNSELLYLKTLGAQRHLEKRIQATVFGPHRDDFKLIKEETRGKTILQKELAGFGSRAEQRQALLLLKIVEAKLYKDLSEEAPSILLDDVASELDKKNRELFLSRIWSNQVFITTTSLETIPVAMRQKSQLLKMEEGSLTPI
jgi:DNA replication and repair protein RecF